MCSIEVLLEGGRALEAPVARAVARLQLMTFVSLIRPLSFWIHSEAIDVVAATAELRVASWVVEISNKYSIPEVAQLMTAKLLHK